MTIDAVSIASVLNHFLPSIRAHRNQYPSTPFILALSGLQGSGKSTWAADVCKALNEQHGLVTRTISLDDLYYDHERLVAVRHSNPDNLLLRTRGQPGTHDEALAKQFFASLVAGSSQQDIAFPAFDKSCHGGEGDRVPTERWHRLPRTRALDVLVFEGWCLGFQPRPNSDIVKKWEAARQGVDSAGTPALVLANHSLQHLLVINENLKRYCHAFMGPSHLHGLVQLTADELGSVYRWRIEQERALRAAVGDDAGMTDGQVMEFVDGYMPAYELYLEKLSTEPLFGQSYPEKKHVRVALDVDRTVAEIGRA